MDLGCEVIRPLDSLLGHEALAARVKRDRLCDAVFGGGSHIRGSGGNSIIDLKECPCGSPLSD
jgi:hypothetical protein